MSEKAAESNELCIVSVEEFVKLKLPPLENILDPWLGTQGLALIYAPRGSIRRKLSGMECAQAARCIVFGWRNACQYDAGAF